MSASDVDFFLSEQNYWYFISNFVKTVDEKDPRNPVKAFPDDRPYFEELIKQWTDLFYANFCQVALHPKSRQMMVSWLVDSFLLAHTMFCKRQLCIIQSKKEADSIYQLDRIKQTYSLLPPEFQNAYPLSRAISRQRETVFEFAPEIGSKLIAAPQGADTVRGYSPSVLFLDEAQNQDLLEETIETAIPCCQLIIIVGTANRGGTFQRLVEGTL